MNNTHYYVSKTYFELQIAVGLLERLGFKNIGTIHDYVRLSERHPTIHIQWYDKTFSFFYLQEPRADAIELSIKDLISIVFDS